MVAVWSVTSGLGGRWLDSGTEMVNVAELERVPSLAVMLMVRVAGVSASSGVPLSVCDSESKVSHAGRALPSSNIAV